MAGMHSACSNYPIAVVYLTTIFDNNRGIMLSPSFFLNLTLLIERPYSFQGLATLFNVPLTPTAASPTFTTAPLASHGLSPTLTGDRIPEYQDLAPLPMSPPRIEEPEDPEWSETSGLNGVVENHPNGYVPKRQSRRSIGQTPPSVPTADRSSQRPSSIRTIKVIGV